MDVASGTGHPHSSAKSNLNSFPQPSAPVGATSGANRNQLQHCKQIQLPDNGGLTAAHLVAILLLHLSVAAAVVWSELGQTGISRDSRPSPVQSSSLAAARRWHPYLPAKKQKPIW